MNEYFAWYFGKTTSIILDEARVADCDVRPAETPPGRAGSQPVAVRRIRCVLNGRFLQLPLY
jgi:hypothetical protein